MSLQLVTAATVNPITDNQAWAHLRLNSPPPDQTMVGRIITAATAMIDGRDGWLGRQIVQATWDYYLDAFPVERFIALPLAPVRSITTITYVDTDGAEQTLSSSDASYGWALSSDRDWKPKVQLNYDTAWPGTRTQPEAVKVRFVAGYADDGASPPDYRANVPETIKQAVLLLCGHFYENAEQATDRRITEIPLGVQALLDPYRRIK